MEAISILPVKASHQTATPLGTTQGTPGLGDLFEALLREATIRLDARPADLASFDSRRTSVEPPRRISAADTISSIDRAPGVEYDAEVGRNPIEPSARTERYAEVIDGDEFADPAPEDDAEPIASAAGDETPVPADGDIQIAEGENAEVPTAQNQDDPAPEEIAALPALPALPAALPVPAQTMAATTALGVAQALGPNGAAEVALARAATQSQVPAHAAQQAQTASNLAPAAGRLGAEVGATRVQVTPAAVVAQPNAALGGGAATAALAAQNSQAGVPAASQILAATTASGSQNQAKPGNRTGPMTGGQSPAGTAPGTTNAGNGSIMTASHRATQGAVMAAEAAPGSGLQGQGQGAPIPGATGEPGGAQRNAQTAFAESNNQNAANSATTGGLSAEAPASEAGVQNRLGQNAQTAQTNAAKTNTAQPLAAPASGADGAAKAEGGRQPGASRAAADTTQGAHPAALESNQNNATQTAARGDGSAPAGVTAQGVAQNIPSGTAAATERAMAPASVQGNGQTNTNSSTAAGTPGLIQAAIHTPQTLPAQARPAATPSLPANQVAVHIQRAVAAGQNRISISLHPAELGQIDVKLNIGNDGAVKAIVSIERPETFELLQRDARGLEKALQDAGLKTDSGSLSFNLKGEEEQNAAARRDDSGTGSQEAGTETPDEPELAPEIIVAANPGGIEHALDLHV